MILAEMKYLNFFNLLIYTVYFRVLYLCALVFSAICFHLIFHFYDKNQIAQVFATTFMTFVFYIAAEGADLLCEIFDEKIKEFKLFTKA